MFSVDFLAAAKTIFFLFLLYFGPALDSSWGFNMKWKAQIEIWKCFILTHTFLNLPFFYFFNQKSFLFGLKSDLTVVKGFTMKMCCWWVTVCLLFKGYPWNCFVSYMTLNTMLSCKNLQMEQIIFQRKVGHFKLICELRRKLNKGPVSIDKSTKLEHLSLHRNTVHTVDPQLLTI